VLVETDGGVKGWASGNALQIDFHEPDEYE
jgi:hypothetical protein